MGNERKVMDDLKRLLLLIPFGVGEAVIRTQLAQRMAIDERSLEVLGENGREIIRQQANVPAGKTFDRGISYGVDAGLFKVKRVYSSVERSNRSRQHSGRYGIHDCEWPTTTEELEQRVAEAVKIRQSRPDKRRSTSSMTSTCGRHQRRRTLDVMDDVTETSWMTSRNGMDDVDHYKDNGEVNGEVTAKGGAPSGPLPGSFVGAPLPPEVPRTEGGSRQVGAQAKSPPTPHGAVADATNLDILSQSKSGGIFWPCGSPPEPDMSPSGDYLVKDATEYDRATGQIRFFNGAGSEFEAELRRDFGANIEIERILRDASDWARPGMSDVERKKAVRRSASKLYPVQRTSNADRVARRIDKRFRGV